MELFVPQCISALTTQLTPNTKAQVQKQVSPGERLVQDPQCTSKTVSDHQANEHALSVTVKVSVTCSGLAYTEQAIDSTAIQAYMRAGSAQLGSGYGVVGDMIVSQPMFPTLLPSGQKVVVTIRGIWSFQYTPIRLQEIKRLIAGKSQQAALQLLHSRKDIQNVTIATSGDIGTAVPNTLEGIKLIVVQIAGLKGSA